MICYGCRYIVCKIGCWRSICLSVGCIYGIWRGVGDLVWYGTVVARIGRVGGGEVFSCLVLRRDQDWNLFLRASEI